MKEPKFRGYSIETNSWHYGHGWFEIDYTDEYLKEKGIDQRACLLTDSYPVECELASMGQFTGLKDNNGCEIYEGDIVQYLDGHEWSTESGYDCEEFDNNGVIFFDTQCGRYDVTNKQGLAYDDLFDCGIDFVVLGNKYENPDLLNT